jgi:C_GCAxxG_C_C family probable redox protein
MSNADLAMAHFKEGFSCSQSVLAAYAPTLGLDRETAFRIAGAFGGGMGRMGETCGAVTGALMVIGLRYGPVAAEDEQAKEKLYELAREVANKFSARNNGCIKCRELLGCGIDTPEGLQLAREKELFTTLCPKFVYDAARIVESILDA